MGVTSSQIDSHKMIPTGRFPLENRIKLVEILTSLFPLKQRKNFLKNVLKQTLDKNVLTNQQTNKHLISKSLVNWFWFFFNSYNLYTILYNSTLINTQQLVSMILTEMDIFIRKFKACFFHNKSTSIIKKYNYIDNSQIRTYPLGSSKVP